MAKKLAEAFAVLCKEYCECIRDPQAQIYHPRYTVGSAEVRAWVYRRDQGRPQGEELIGLLPETVHPFLPAKAWEGASFNLAQDGCSVDSGLGLLSEVRQFREELAEALLNDLTSY